MPRKRVRPEEECFIDYGTVKVAAGGGGSGNGGSRGGGSGGGGRYRAGQIVECKITGPEPGGYACITVQDKLPAFLPTTDRRLKFGQLVTAQFVCVHRNRLLVMARFDNKQPLAKDNPDDP